MPVSSPTKTANTNSAALTKMARKIDRLPLLPQVLVRILQTSTDRDDFFDEIDRLARQDPPFAVRLLGVANSASSSPVSPVKSIKDALTRVGAATITRLVASLAVQRVFMPSCSSQVALWRHSIRVAMISEAVAQLAPSLKIEKGQAYLVGLLHDIGRFVMFEHAPDELLKVDESHWHTPEELIEADVEIFTYTHSELGYLACKHWGLPDDIAHTVRRHHEKLTNAIEPGSLEASILCVEVADRLDLMVLENYEPGRLSAKELAQRIDQDCLYLPLAKKLIRADALASKIDQMAAQSAQLLGGLGIT